MDGENPAQLPPRKWDRLVLSCLAFAAMIAPGTAILAGTWGMPIWLGVLWGAMLGVLYRLLLFVGDEVRWFRRLMVCCHCVGAYAVVGGAFAAFSATPTWGVPVWLGAAGGTAFGLLVCAGIWIVRRYATELEDVFGNRAG